MKLVAIVLLSLGGIKVGKAEPVADRCNINAALIFHQEIRLSQEYKKNLIRQWQTSSDCINEGIGNSA